MTKEKVVVYGLKIYLSIYVSFSVKFVIRVLALTAIQLLERTRKPQGYVCDKTKQLLYMA